MPSTRCRARSMSLMTRPLWRIGSSFSPLSSTRSKARSPTPATSFGRAWRPMRTRILGAGPCSASSHSVGSAISDVAEHDGGQGAEVMQLLAAALDAALVGKLAQHALERGAIGILQAERARDLAGADLAGLLADEGEKVVFGGKGRLGLGTGHENKIREQNSLTS